MVESTRVRYLMFTTGPHHTHVQTYRNRYTSVYMILRLQEVGHDSSHL